MTKPPVFSTGRLMMSITPIQLNTAAHTKFAARGSGPLSAQCFVMSDKLAHDPADGGLFATFGPGRAVGGGDDWGVTLAVAGWTWASVTPLSTPPTWPPARQHSITLTYTALCVVMYVHDNR